MKRKFESATGIHCQYNSSIIGKASTAGITLVALVVTIVVLLILAGITIVYVFGDNGVFGQASEAKLKTDIANWQERLELAKSPVFVEGLGTFNSDKYFEYIEQQGIIDDREMDIIGNEDGTYDVTTKPGYVFLVTLLPNVEEPTDAEIEYIGESGKISPKIVNINVIEITESTIKVQAEVRRLKKEKIEYSYKLKESTNEEEYITMTVKDKIATAINLKDDKYYNIKVGIRDLEGNLITEKCIDVKTIPNLKVGTIVNYELEGNEYEYLYKYASAHSTGKKIISSKENGAYRITKWKVLSINHSTKKVELIPEFPTTGKVLIGKSAHGYNNGVKLLNDACKALYSEPKKGITSRSTCLEDIIKYIDANELSELKNKLGFGTTITCTRDASERVPAISKDEIGTTYILSNSDTSVTQTTGLQPNKQTSFYEEKQGLEYYPGACGMKSYTTTKSSLYVSKEAKFIKVDENFSYADVIFPQQGTAWLATRIRDTYTGDGSISFGISSISSSNIGGHVLTTSKGGYFPAEEDKDSLFPLITVPYSEIVIESNNFVIK